MDRINIASNKIYYSWHELKKDAGGHPEGILILTYALYKKYNTLLSKNTEQLCKKLHIDKIPTKILRDNRVIISHDFNVLKKCNKQIVWEFEWYNKTQEIPTF